VIAAHILDGCVGLDGNATGGDLGIGLRRAQAVARFEILGLLHRLAHAQVSGHRLESQPHTGIVPRQLGHPCHCMLRVRAVRCVVCVCVRYLHLMWCACAVGRSVGGAFALLSPAAPATPATPAGGKAAAGGAESQRDRSSSYQQRYDYSEEADIGPAVEEFSKQLREWPCVQLPATWR
jgi:hypothetical protein